VTSNQRWLAMRKRDVTPTVADLERPEPGEPRELTALRHNVKQLRREFEDGQDRPTEQAQRPREQAQQAQPPRAQAQRLREQEKLLRAMLGSRAFTFAEQLSRLHKRGRPVFSRQQVRRALGDEDGPA
jgi:hypothetical protein